MTELCIIHLLPLKALWTGVDDVDADAETTTRVQEDQQAASLKESA